MRREAGCDPAKQHGAGYPACAKRVAAPPMEGALSSDQGRSEGGGSSGSADGGGAEPQ